SCSFHRDYDPLDEEVSIRTSSCYQSQRRKLAQHGLRFPRRAIDTGRNEQDLRPEIRFSSSPDLRSPTQGRSSPGPRIRTLPPEMAHALHWNWGNGSSDSALQCK